MNGSANMPSWCGYSRYSRGHFDVVMAHPEALLCTWVGKQLRCSEAFISNVFLLFVDECHTADLWYVVM